MELLNVFHEGEIDLEQAVEWNENVFDLSIKFYMV